MGGGGSAAQPPAEPAASAGSPARSSPSSTPSDQPSTPQQALLGGAKLAMQNAPPWLKAVIYACLVMGILALVIIAVPPYASQKELDLFALAGAFLLAFLVLLIVTVAYFTKSKQGTAPPAGLSANARLMAIHPFLENARSNVRNYLQRLDPSVTDDDVRANIFLPTKVRVGLRYQTRLVIPARLCIKMNEANERAVSFAPGEGATGQAFQQDDVLIVCRNPPGQTQWDSKYRLTPDQLSCINPDLKWIISMPIRGPSRTVVGVANVDCLRHEFPYDQLVAGSDQAVGFVEMIGQFF